MARPPPNPGSSSGLHFLNSPFGDTTFTKVFVGGLAWETSSETLGRHFEQFGEILEAVVITDKNSGRSKGYGFVTFLDPEAARRACSDPNPVIDGRRANCNLASLKRTWPGPGYARMRPAVPFIGSAPPPTRGAFVGASHPQQQIPYGYQQGFMYPPYGFMNYGPEYAYPQNIYGAYPGQQYLQMYGAPGTASPAVYPFGQLSQHIPSGLGYPTAQGYGIASQQLMRFSGPNLNGAAAAPIPTISASYPQGVAAPTPQPFFMVPVHSSQFTQGSGSEQNNVQKEP